MCVLIHSKRKDLLPRKELEQAMKSNGAGFWMALLRPKGVRETIRTLDAKEFLDFFDKAKDDDEVVVHCRIPSRGETNAGNVHGWEEDGILFGHNMTLAALDDMIERAEWKGTDSEFFFKKIFIPFKRGLGKGAYKDGALHPDLDNLVRHFCGRTNKFLFVMPDNQVLRYGDWVEEKDRVVDGKVAFYASNSSYKVYERTWGRQSAASYGSDYEDWESAYGHYHGGGRQPLPVEDRALKAVDAGITLPDGVRMALMCLAAKGYAEYRSLMAGEDGAVTTDGESFALDADAAADVTDAFEAIMPALFTDEVYADVADLVEIVGRADEGKRPKAVADEIAAFLATHADDILAYGVGSRTAPGWPTAAHAQKALARLNRDMLAFCMATGLRLDFAREDYAVAFDMEPCADGTYRAVRVDTVDLVVPDHCAGADIADGIVAMVAAVADAGEKKKKGAAA